MEAGSEANKRMAIKRNNETSSTNQLHLFLIDKDLRLSHVDEIYINIFTSCDNIFKDDSHTKS